MVRSIANRIGGVTIFTNKTWDLPKIPEEFKRPKMPTTDLAIFEEYQTALGVDVMINHVGDCFD